MPNFLQALPTEKSTHPASYRSSGFGLFQDALLVLRGVDPAFRFGNHLGVGTRGRHRIGAHFGCRSTTVLWRGSLTPFRASQSLRGKNTNRIYFFSLSPWSSIEKLRELVLSQRCWHGGIYALPLRARPGYRASGGMRQLEQNRCFGSGFFFLVRL
jgi:hypothetical protein